MAANTLEPIRTTGRFFRKGDSRVRADLDKYVLLSLTLSASSSSRELSIVCMGVTQVTLWRMIACKIWSETSLCSKSSA